MRPVVALGATSAGTIVGSDADADVYIGSSDNNDGNDVTGSSGIASLEGETRPRGDSLCQSPRSSGMPM